MAQDNVTLANDPKLTGKKVLFDFSVDFWGEVDERKTIAKVRELVKRVLVLESIARGRLDDKRQSMKVFYARQLLNEIKETIELADAKDGRYKTVLTYNFFEKHKDVTLKDLSFSMKHNISESDYYRVRDRAYLRFAYWFNAGELLVFKQGETAK
ncbi:hypothetical protein [Streptococcus hyointestinalis]|uniref:hypothetical protein n=1 Tax=Streptococcus hyointestinalis TaxID=1337 RepID=UPI0013E00B0F|nr:hypothetical protein [Streptococcus hyointestinalis]